MIRPVWCHQSMVEPDRPDLSGPAPTVTGMTEIGTDWRVIHGVATTWFDAPSLTAGAALVGRIKELSAEILLAVRATCSRVRVDSNEDAEAVSAAARDLG